MVRASRALTFAARAVIHSPDVAVSTGRLSARPTTFPPETPGASIMPGRAIVASLYLISGLVIGTETHGGQPPSVEQAGVLTAEETTALDRISADSLRGHVSFLASDLLEGRGTPSRGLDLAAEYIAAGFRGAGLEPGGDEGYFQTAHWREARFNEEGFSATLRVGEKARSLKVAQITLRYAEHPIEIKNAQVVKVDALDQKSQDAIRPDEVKGKVFLVEQPAFDRVDRSKSNQVIGGYFRFLDRLASEQAGARFQYRS